jgi:hypothetical protein
LQVTEQFLWTVEQGMLLPVSTVPNSNQDNTPELHYIQGSTNKRCLIVIGGPTATGKTGLSLAIAARWPIALLSADSRLVYRELDIGTAKPTG